MKNLLKYIRAGILQCIILPQIRNSEQLSRFTYIQRHYLGICKKLSIWGYRGKTNIYAYENYDWKVWSINIKNAFQRKVPLTFRWQPIIAKTMVFGGFCDFEITQRRIEFILSVYHEELAKKLLREDYIGLPKITDAHYMTSANRAHHAYHLASYENLTKKSIYNCDCVIEWGGGYGDLARIIRRVNNRITYISIDLPELGALQYVYLFSLEGEAAVNLVLPGTKIIPGKVNILPVTAALQGKIEIFGQAFISTWALTECPKEIQLFVFRKAFFSSSQILMAYKIDKNNHIRELLSGVSCVLKPIVILGDGHEYAFR